MEAVLASAAYLEQGIAWGKFCCSNSCLKHALCVGTKNYLSAEAVSYKNGIFHWVLFWRPFSPSILACCWLSAAISLFIACTGPIRLIALLKSKTTKYFRVIWWPESSFSSHQNDCTTRRGRSQFDFCFSGALNLDLLQVHRGIQMVLWCCWGFLGFIFAIWALSVEEPRPLSPSWKWEVWHCGALCFLFLLG